MMKTCGPFTKTHTNTLTVLETLVGTVSHCPVDPFFVCRAILDQSTLCITDDILCERCETEPVTSTHCDRTHDYHFQNHSKVNHILLVSNLEELRKCPQLATTDIGVF